MKIMKRRNTQSVPQAREDGLVVRELPEELLVYDLDRHEARCLNKPAALIWKHCDGKNTVAQITRLLEKELKTTVNEEVVWYTINRLGKAHLLKQRVTRPAGAAFHSRRELMAKVGKAAMLSLPLIVSITSPRAVAAATLRCFDVNTEVGKSGCQQFPCSFCFNSKNGDSDCDFTKKCKASGSGECVGLPASNC
jgi:hypothetical protein